MFYFKVYYFKKNFATQSARVKKFLFLLLHELFQRRKMLLERLATFGRHTVNCVWLAADKAFLATDITQLLQCTRMAGQIAVGQLQQMLEGGKIRIIIHHQHRHDTKSRTAFKRLAQTEYRYFHLTFHCISPS